MGQRKYIFTDKKHPPKAIMSSVMGLIANASIGYAIYASYKLKAEVTERLGATGVLIILMATVGLVLGYISKTEPNKFYLFSYIGIILNLFALLAVSMVLHAGAYGI